MTTIERVPAIEDRIHVREGIALSPPLLEEVERALADKYPGPASLEEATADMKMYRQAVLAFLSQNPDQDVRAWYDGRRVKPSQVWRQAGDHGTEGRPSLADRIKATGEGYLSYAPSSEDPEQWKKRGKVLIALSQAAIGEPTA